jgi:hypothetical protein
MTAFSVRSSCDMLARNSDLCRLATPPGRPGLQGVTRSTLRMAIAACGEGGQEPGGPLAERVDLGPPDDQDADHPPSSSMGTPMVVRSRRGAGCRAARARGRQGRRICWGRRSSPTRRSGAPVLPGDAGRGRRGPLGERPDAMASR